MAGMDQVMKKELIRYVKKHYPDEAAKIIQRAESLYPLMHEKAPDIGGKENLMAYNLDLMILAVSFYEASGHRIDGKAITEIAEELYRKMKILRVFLNVNRKWQMKLFRALMYQRYVPYAELVEEKLSQGLWGNTWRISIHPETEKEGVCFDLIGCPLADYAKANGYEDLLPSLCATDHMMAKLLHAKLIRTHTCATGSSSCDYWYVGDRSSTAKAYENVKML